MKITISSSGNTFRTAPLACLLDKRGVLDRLYIPYLSQKNSRVSKIFGWNTEHYLIDLSKVHTNINVFLLKKFIDKTGVSKINTQYYRFLFAEIFDKHVSSQLKEGSSIVFAESLMALNTIKRAKKLGVTAILDRTNSHIQYQTDILKEEYSRLGMNCSFNSPEIIEKSLREYEEADYIAVLSSFVKRTFLEKNVAENKILVIPSAVNFNMFCQVKKQDDKFRIIYCGVSCVKKGTHYLLKAFEELSLKNAELWLIGGIHEEMKPILSKYKDSYRAIGYVPNNKLHEYFSQGSIFVLPSLEEGLAKVIMEAMACGLPVIATKNTGAEDVVRNGRDGFVVPIRDVTTLKEKILFLYQNKDICKQMGVLAKEKIKNNFTLENYADRIISAFKTTFEGKNNSKACLKKD